MNETRPEVDTWTPHWWLLCILLALTAQLASVYWLSPPSTGLTARASTQTRVRVLGLQESQDMDRHLPDKDDPTLFALVGPNGFSRSAWLTIARFEYQMTNRPEPLLWLSMPAEELADDFAEFVQTNLVTEDVVSSKPTPTLAEVSLPVLVVVPETTVRIESGLAGRTLAGNIPPPREPEPILTNSVVQVLVDRAGRTISAALLSGCGVGQADQDALKYSKAARFTAADPPAPGQTGTAFATLVFEWTGVKRPDAVALRTATAQ
jgi:hypothetical protein